MHPAFSARDYTRSTELEPNQWIGTTQHTVLKGRPPENYRLNQHYQTLIEQIRYFNGEFQLLLEQQEPFHWLSEKFPEKMAYFNDYLLKTRETTQKDIHALKTALSSQSVSFATLLTIRALI